LEKEKIRAATVAALPKPEKPPNENLPDCNLPEVQLRNLISPDLIYDDIIFVCQNPILKKNYRSNHMKEFS